MFFQNIENISMTQIQTLFKFLIILQCLSIIYGKSDQDYCKLCLPTPASEHIFCKYPDPGPASRPDCRNVDTSYTDEAFRNRILYWHNDFRNKFAARKWKHQSKDLNYTQSPNFPPAANMRYLMWDYQLEKVAMRHVQNCNDGHEKCMRLGRFGYGQNIGAIYGGDRTINSTENLWEGWIGEMIRYDFANFPKLDTTTQVYHFTCAVWAEVRVIGCAQVYSADQHLNIFTVVCNYAPSCNVMTYNIYIPGKPGSKCPNGTRAGYNSTFPNLCGGVDPEDITYLDPAMAKCIHLKCDWCIVLFLLSCVEIFNFINIHVLQCGT